MEIGCGAYNSFCKTSNDEYYLFGNNEDHQCIVNNDCQAVRIPLYINDIVRNHCKGNIKSLHLGYYNTAVFVEWIIFIIVANNVFDHFDVIVEK